MWKIILTLFVIVASQDDNGEEEQELPQNYQQQQQNYYAQSQYGCIILTKYHLQEKSQDLLQLFKSIQTEQDKRKAYEKLQVQLVQECTSKIQYQQLADLFSQLRQQTFKYSDFSDIFMMTDLSIDNDYTLTSQEKLVAQEIEQFDKNMQEQQRKQNQDDNDDEDDEEIDPRRRQQQQPQGYKLFGFDLSKMSGQAQLIMMSIIILGFSFILFMGLRYVQKETQGPQKRIKKDKKKAK